MSQSSTKQCVVEACILIGLTCAPAAASSISGPLSQATIQGFNTGASYGPPPPVHFFEPGPITVISGTTTDLFAGNRPGQTDVESVLFVISIDPADVGALGTITFNIAGIGSIDFGASDFFSTGDLGFPTPISGIANGEVNGIKFPDALHAAAEAVIDGLGSFAADADINDVTVTSPVDLRVDIFGIDDGGTIINNTPNSGALGVTTLVPLPTAFWPGLATIATCSLVYVTTKRTNNAT